MTTNLLIKHVPADVLRNLKARAKAHNRSLPDEILSILSAVATLGAVESAPLAEKVRKVLSSSASATASSEEKTATVKPTPQQVESKPTTHERKAPTAITQPTQVIRQRKVPL